MLHHGAMDTIVDRVAEPVFDFQFVLSVAVLADVLLGRDVAFGFVDGKGAADGAVHVAGGLSSVRIRSGRAGLSRKSGMLTVKFSGVVILMRVISP